MRSPRHQSQFDPCNRPTFRAESNRDVSPRAEMASVRKAAVAASDFSLCSLYVEDALDVKGTPPSVRCRNLPPLHHSFAAKLIKVGRQTNQTRRQNNGLHRRGNKRSPCANARPPVRIRRSHRTRRLKHRHDHAKPTRRRRVVCPCQLPAAPAHLLNKWSMASRPSS